MITDEMVEKAIHAGTPKPNAIRDHIYQAFDMRAALEAVAPMIRAEALEEAAQQCDFMAVETRKMLERLPKAVRPALEGKLLIQIEAAENRAARIRAMKEPT